VPCSYVMTQAMASVEFSRRAHFGKGLRLGTAEAGHRKCTSLAVR